MPLFQTLKVFPQLFFAFWIPSVLDLLPLSVFWTSAFNRGVCQPPDCASFVRMSSSGQDVGSPRWVLSWPLFVITQPINDRHRQRNWRAMFSIFYLFYWVWWEKINKIWIIWQWLTPGLCPWSEITDLPGWVVGSSCCQSRLVVSSVPVSLRIKKGSRQRACQGYLLKMNTVTIPKNPLLVCDICTPFETWPLVDCL